MKSRNLSRELRKKVSCFLFLKKWRLQVSSVKWAERFGIFRMSPMSRLEQSLTYWTKFEILVISAACCCGGNLDVGVIFPLGLMRLLSAAAEPGSCIWVKSYGHFKGVFMCAVMASHFLLLNGHVWKIGSGCQRPINLRLKPIFTHHAVLC